MSIWNADWNGFGSPSEVQNAIGAGGNIESGCIKSRMFISVALDAVITPGQTPTVFMEMAQFNKGSAVGTERTYRCDGNWRVPGEEATHRRDHTGLRSVYEHDDRCSPR